MIDVSEERVDRGHAAEAGVVPFRRDQLTRAHHAAPEGIQLVAVEHQERGLEHELPENDQEQNEKERRRADRKSILAEKGIFHSLRKVKKVRNKKRPSP